jgi:hypothetical protein
MHRVRRVPDCLVRAAEAVGSAVSFYSIPGRCVSLRLLISLLGVLLFSSARKLCALPKPGN